MILMLKKSTESYMEKLCHPEAISQEEVKVNE